jgi:hypothetical protein
MITPGLRQIRGRDELRLRLFRRLREARTSKCFHHGRDDDENFQDVFFFFFGISRDERIEYCAKISNGGTDSNGGNSRESPADAALRAYQVYAVCARGIQVRNANSMKIVLFVMLAEVQPANTTSVSKCVFSETRLRNDPWPTVCMLTDCLKNAN